MVLKRQTVWLLTMLSLIIVLSVYYININNQDFAGVPENNEDQAVNADSEGDLEEQLLDDENVTFVEIEEAENVNTESTLYGSMSTEEMFDTIRLQRQDARGKMKEDYVAVVASADAGAEVQSQAFDGIEALEVMAQKEEVLETLIKAKGYEDALVITEEDQVRIYVKAEDLSKEEAVQINNMAYEELGVSNIRVGYQSN
ncbi:MULTISPECIES: SpoIIIAH-like family protein [Alteribacter]|uniref:SpoIIIAH-like family protein n=1 Tax=Alteribacter keqinensis TaxID=2483800 RepID=A0A3M7TTX8_9BACI|nr:MULTISPECIES: SpoIIIAH-like family protein [Alteribacter]MBM7097287.1 SpoIIIAH-like family protein [Alteribacter salitolerans]RNA68977.1 SpoIIIAH-like family protein [Alteribacter keqinensis]